MAGQGAYRKPLLDEEGNKIATKYTKGKGKEPLYYGTDVLEMGLERLREYSAHIGKPPSYAPTEEGLKQFAEKVNGYFVELQARNNNSEMTGQIIPSEEGLATYLGINRRTLERYAVERSVEWTEYIDYVKTYMASVKIDAANKGLTQTVWTIFDFKNNHGYKDVNTNVNIDLTNKRAIGTVADLPTLGMNENESLPDKGEMIQANFQEIREPEYIERKED